MMNIFGVSFRGGYLQTWGIVSDIGRLPLIGQRLATSIKWLCGTIVGHTVSKTEWGYGGGEYGDVWCRWCNQKGQIPYSELEDRFANARATLWKLTGKDISQGPL